VSVLNEATVPAPLEVEMARPVKCAPARDLFARP
jgi:hypothetical protein